MRFVFVKRCGEIRSEEIRKKDIVEKWGQCADEGSTITDTYISSVPKACKTCQYAKIHYLTKEEIIKEYRHRRASVYALREGIARTSCEMRILKAGQMLPGDWIDRDLNLRCLSIQKE